MAKKMLQRKQTKKLVFLFVIFLTLINGLHAQTTFPEGDFWSLDLGIGMSNILVEGESFQLILDPKLWLSPKLMVGSKVGINYSTDNILTFEGQVYLRWNFLRPGSPEKITNIFIQGGMGMLAAYRGNGTPFDNVTRTRGSLLFDAALGVTIPLAPRWHIEPSIRGGYPHIAGFSITAGYKFPLPEKTKYEQLPGTVEYVPEYITEYVPEYITEYVPEYITEYVPEYITEYVPEYITEYVPEYITEYKTEYVEIIKTVPPVEIIKLTLIDMIEYILFGPDIGEYNVGIDHDAESLNELVLNEIALVLSENPNLLVRIEGHANPVTTNPAEVDELLALSTRRANQVANQLRARGVAEGQMAVIAYGGTRTVTSDHDIWNRNRRVELIIIQLDTN